LLRGRLALADGENAVALADAEAAVALAPDDPRTRALRWQALQGGGRLAEAEAGLDAVAASPFMQAQRDLWRAAAGLSLRGGRVADGTRWLEGALEGEPTWIEGWDRLARAYGDAGRTDDAARAARNAARARQNEVLLAQRDARLAALRGDWTRAVDLLEQAR